MAIKNFATKDLGDELNGDAIPLLAAIVELSGAALAGQTKQGAALTAIENLAKTALRRVDRVAMDLGGGCAGQYLAEFERLASTEQRQ